MKSKIEVEQLKNNWLSDPCYDLEDVEGFEEYKTELIIFSLTHKLIWTRTQLNELLNFKIALKKLLE